VLTAQTIVATPTIAVDAVRCSDERDDWTVPEPVHHRTLVLIRSGLFRRRVGSRDAVLDSSSAYLPRPGTEQAFAHPMGGDRCTSMAIRDPEIAALLADCRWPDTRIAVSPETDLAHRALLARAGAGATPDELAERAHVLVGSVLDLGDQLLTLRGPPGSQRAVDQVRVLLAEDSAITLADLSRHTGLSAYYLSRAFRRTAGCTITAYRIRLRLRAALDQLATGETDLATVAAETGFSDQAHLTRMLRREAGATPGAVRRLFATGG
jgi:AraC-like DNA-binding protein